MDVCTHGWSAGPGRFHRSWSTRGGSPRDPLLGLTVRREQGFLALPAFRPSSAVADTGPSTEVVDVIAVVSVFDLIGVNRQGALLASDLEMNVEWATDRYVERYTDIAPEHSGCVRLACARSGELLERHYSIRSLVERGQLHWNLFVAVTVCGTLFVHTRRCRSRGTSNEEVLGNAMRSLKQSMRRKRKHWRGECKRIRLELKRAEDLVWGLRQDYSGSEDDSACTTPPSSPDDTSQRYD